MTSLAKASSSYSYHSTTSEQEKIDTFPLGNMHRSVGPVEKWHGRGGPMVFAWWPSLHDRRGIVAVTS